MKSGSWLIGAVALAVGAAAGALGMGLAASDSINSPSAQPIGPGMMRSPGGMMGGGSDVPGGASGGLVTAKRMQSLATAAVSSVSRRGSTLTCFTRQVTLVALGAPGNRPGMFWQIDGVDGPTVSIPAGATITVEFADGDPGHAHGLELTTAAPPYPRMAMMDGYIAASGAFIMPVPPPQGDLWYSATTRFAAPAPGTYYIICPVPGHAKQGMWARFVVR